MGNYRKIYKQYYGEIPRDKYGRKYDIHHIDGNHSNDLPENLKAVTIQEHYDIHYDRGDYGACQSIIVRMNLTSKEISENCRELNKKRVQNGTHPFMRRPDGSSISLDRVIDGTLSLLGGEIQRRTQNQKVIDGTHNFLGNGELQRRTAQKTNQRTISDGSHQLLKENQKRVTCPYCSLTSNEGNMKRWHFDNCRLKPSLEVSPVGVQGLLGPNGVAVSD